MAADEPSHELTADEQRLLRSLKRDQEPPPHVETAILEALRRSGSLPTRRRPLSAIAWLASAAAILMAVVWMSSGKHSRIAPTHDRFMLLLYDGDSASTAHATNQRREYAAWARRIAAQGVSIEGEELADGGQELGADGAVREMREVAVPRGYFVVSAADAASAIRIASSCPHLQHGGRIVVRRIPR